jgi:two-component system response regulator QseB
MSVVLVIDDDEAMLRMMRLVLESEGFAVETAATREDALAQIGARVPDVVVMDYRMAGLAPDAFIESARTAGLTAPILLCTGMQEDLRLVVDDVLVKPFDIDELARRVRALADRASTRSPDV